MYYLHLRRLWVGLNGFWKNIAIRRNGRTLRGNSRRYAKDTRRTDSYDSKSHLVPDRAKKRVTILLTRDSRSRTSRDPRVSCEKEVSVSTFSSHPVRRSDSRLHLQCSCIWMHN